MQMRLHPAESRVKRLSAEIPAIFIAFDLLLWDGEPVHERPLEERRAELLRRGDGFWISPATTSLDAATAWLDRFEAAGSRRGDREAARARLHARLARGGRQGEGAQDRRLRRRSASAGSPAARSSPPCCSGSTATTARSTTSARPRSAPATTTRSPRACCRSSTSAPTAASRSRTAGAPTGSRRRRSARARRRGALRQGAGQPLPPRHQADPLPRRQGPDQCTWREVRPPKRADDPTVENLLERA